MNKWISTFTSRCLVFRPFEYTDAQIIYNNWGKFDDVSKYVTWWSHSCINDTIKYVNDVIFKYASNSDYMEWLVCLRETGEPIGAISIQKPHGKWIVGYNFAKSQWHKGYATEALSRIIEFSFLHRNIPAIYSSHLEENKASGYVMKRNGLTYEKTESIIIKNVETNLLWYKLDRIDWLSEKVKSFVSTLNLDDYTLRPVMSSDIDYIHEYFSDPDVIKYLHANTKTSKNGVKNKVCELLTRCVKGNYYYWVIVDDNDKPIGNISVSIDSPECANVAYVLSKDKWGNGIMSKALGVVIDYVFKLFKDVWFIGGDCAIDNKASKRVMEKCGMTCYGIYRYGVMQFVKCPYGEYPLVRCQISRADWRRLNNET